MYVPRHFSMTAEQIGDVLSHVGAGDLVTQGPDGLSATFLPMLYDPGVGEHGSLLAHLTRNNIQWQHAEHEALVIVHGPDHYISPIWLTPPEAEPQVVPTWNYVTIHAYGRLIAHDDPAWKRDLVARLSARHEEEYRLEAVPADLVTRMLRAVVGVEFRITRIEAKAKLSQNKLPHDVAAIIDGLRSVGEADAVELADWMATVSLPAAERRSDLIDELARKHRSAGTPR